MKTTLTICSLMALASNLVSTAPLPTADARIPSFLSPFKGQPVYAPQSIRPELNDIKRSAALEPAAEAGPLHTSDWQPITNQPAFGAAYFGGKKRCAGLEPVADEETTQASYPSICQSGINHRAMWGGSVGGVKKVMKNILKTSIWPDDCVKKDEKEGHVKGKASTQKSEGKEAMKEKRGVIDAENLTYGRPELIKDSKLVVKETEKREVGTTHQDCAAKHNISQGLAHLHEVLTANHISEVEAELRERGAEECILTVGELKKTSMAEDGTTTTTTITETTASEMPATDDAGNEGSRDTFQSLAPLVEMQEAHYEHGEHGDGSGHDASTEAEALKQKSAKMEKMEKMEKRLLLIPQVKDLDKSQWIGVDGVAF